jgi:hypothetical protein
VGGDRSDALTHNVRLLAERGAARLYAVVKANAYGHGAVVVGRGRSKPARRGLPWSASTRVKSWGAPASTRRCSSSAQHRRRGSDDHRAPADADGTSMPMATALSREATRASTVVECTRT